MTVPSVTLRADVSPRRRRRVASRDGRPATRRTHGATGPALATHRSLGRRRSGRHDLPGTVATPESRALVLAAIDHELRTPLTSVVGYVEMLLDGEAGRLDEDQARMLQRIDVNASRLLVVVDALLAGCSAGLRRGEVVDLAATVVAALGGAETLVARMPPGPGGAAPA